MTGGYESLVWIRDKDGREYACSLDSIKGDIREREELTDEERSQCMDVSTIIGTERW